jgi:uncharacterized protein
VADPTTSPAVGLRATSACVGTLCPMTPTDRLDVDALRRLVAVYRDAVSSHAVVLNLLNVYPVPDGDTGTNMARTLDAVVAEMDAAASGDLEAVCEAISHGSLMGARGNSGVILSQILRGIATTLRHGGADGPADAGRRLADALVAGAAGAYQAVLKPVEGTILTVVRESSEAAQRVADDGLPLAEVVQAARAAGKAALDRTPELLPVLKDAGVVDAGGAGFLLFLDAALHVVAGVPLPDPPDVEGHPEAARGGGGSAAAHDREGGPKVSGVGGELDVSEQRYEVMYFCELPDDLIDDFKHGWGEIGDSIVVVGGDGLWNCHVHTNDIGAAIEVALDLDGRPRQIRVTDLFEEVADEHDRRDSLMHEDDRPPATPVPAVTCGVVAVCSGDGIAELAVGLGVQEVVAGGQTLNPSTAELLAAVERVPADEVLILPNNKNIVPVAEQVDALTAKTVLVVPSRSMPEGLACLVEYDPRRPVDVNHAAMTAAIDTVLTGEITCAVRDSSSEVGPVRLGDWIGLVRGEGIVSVAPTVEAAATTLLDQLVGPDRELVTILTGSDADPVVTAAIEGWLADERADVQVEVHRGGQPLYPYLFGVE